MTKAELDAIREKIAGEPEGSPARILLAEVDRLIDSANQRAHAEMRQRLMKHDHLTEEEAEKVIGIFMTGNMPEMVMGTCRACDGHGRTSTSGCFGPRLGDRCPKCRGRGQSMQYKIPA